MKHKKETAPEEHVPAQRCTEKEIRTALLLDKIPFVFEKDKKLVAELAIENSYIRSLFKL